MRVPTGALVILSAMAFCCHPSSIVGQDRNLERLPFLSEPLPTPLPSPSPATQRPRLRLAAPERNNVSRGSDRRTSTSDVAPESMLNRLEAVEREEISRLKRIRAKLDRLKKIAESCKQSTSTAQKTPARTADPPTPARPRQEPTPERQQQEQPNRDSLPVGPLTDESPTPSDFASDTSFDAPVDADATNSSTVPLHLTATVDSLALANNLFAQGKTGEAKPIYEQLIRIPQKASDLVWIQYQLASCYRMEGKVKEAVKFYRSVAGNKTEEYWKSRAVWWLNYLDRSQAIIERRQGLETRLEDLRKQANELRKQ